jgi:molybdate-binding protein
MRVAVADVELGFASREGFSLEDLASVRFLRPPRGSSARVLAEEIFLMKGMAPEPLPEYSGRVRTDEGVTTAILNGSVDAGVCRSESAVNAGLAWEPIGFESFEMVFPGNTAECTPLASAIRALRSSGYRNSVDSLTGYSAKRSGQMTPCMPEAIARAVLK